jgi:hypothetical protein
MDCLRQLKWTCASGIQTAEYDPNADMEAGGTLPKFSAESHIDCNSSG